MTKTTTNPDPAETGGPLVTVLTGSYNNARTLRRSIEAILSQTITNLELVVIDDGSEDATAAIGADAAKEDNRVRLLQMHRNVGIAASLNAGIAVASAPIIAVQDADDYSSPCRLEKQLDILARDPNIAVVGCRMREVGARGEELEPRTSFAAGLVNDSLMRFNPIPNTCAAFRRDAITELGGYDSRYRYAMEYDLWLKVAEEWTVYTIDELLATRTMSGTNASSLAEREQIREALTIRARAMFRRRSPRDATSLLLPTVSYCTPLPFKRARRRFLRQAP